MIIQPAGFALLEVNEFLGGERRRVACHHGAGETEAAIVAALEKGEEALDIGLLDRAPVGDGQKAPQQPLRILQGIRRLDVDQDLGIPRQAASGLGLTARSAARAARRRGDHFNFDSRFARGFLQRQIAEEQAIPGSGRLIVERSFNLHPLERDAGRAVDLGELVDVAIEVAREARPRTEEANGVGGDLLVRREVDILELHRALVRSEIEGADPVGARDRVISAIDMDRLAAPAL